MIEKNILNGFLDIRQNIALQIYTSSKHICKPRFYRKNVFFKHTSKDISDVVSLSSI